MAWGTSLRWLAAEQEQRIRQQRRDAPRLPAASDIVVEAATFTPEGEDTPRRIFILGITPLDDTVYVP